MNLPKIVWVTVAIVALGFAMANATLDAQRTLRDGIEVLKPLDGNVAVTARLIIVHAALLPMAIVMLTAFMAATTLLIVRVRRLRNTIDNLARHLEDERARHEQCHRDVKLLVEQIKEDRNDLYRSVCSSQRAMQTLEQIRSDKADVMRFLRSTESSRERRSR